MGEKIELLVTKKDFTLITTAVTESTVVSADNLLRHILVVWAIAVSNIEGYTHIVAFGDGTYGAKFDVLEPFINESCYGTGIALVGKFCGGED